MTIRIAIGLTVLTALSGVTVAACAPLKPEGAECSGLIYRKCVITDGSYAGISTSMTYVQAFDAVCRNIRRQKFEPRPLVYSVGDLSGFYRGDFCDQPIENLRHDYWAVRQPGFLRDVGISSRFEEGVIVQINVGYRGWDP
jgi:hypothetical protein